MIARCHLPNLRQWGWTVQVYAVRSRRSWGIGDFGDLARFAQWSKQLGAGFVMCNPLGPGLPLVRQENCPYYMSSRVWLNPLYIEIPTHPELGAVADSARKLNGNR